MAKAAKNKVIENNLVINIIFIVSIANGFLAHRNINIGKRKLKDKKDI